uniref:3-hydroxy-3-methylglutaryl coenzyme A reductase n=1 Tax=Mucochytrium quahogii TaxID=96639 RepID=A0A7S2RTI0_9STRA|mmetsp:Transcript_28444/g.45807  ORF Transcript_28444/g.45807 Transcript_28444/m.45807 type:complete len:453 (+) Transcript_28444:278-1636(+)|eukprot:CAMPEP_0203774554 /NCGR_PEP_ID=MMETSP0099_2-20121227/5424_1 /ASSEMBLY_ACC=CAM_ASM_000209 /TAXON_ID=96639 /ORGANISM=" , Strain NY0313808BC1" /LENGTH=452 /DNA_ID=CAMNT_0050672801 /DNA_START=237 /DNA_END=1595 /DNA_ORIENTATION=-
MFRANALRQSVARVVRGGNVAKHGRGLHVRSISTVGGRTVTTTAGEARLEEEGVDNVPHYKLEQYLGDNLAAARTRKERLYPTADNIPVEGNDFDTQGFYDQVHGTNCENVIGFLPIPIGVIGPVLVNGEEYMVPMATTEGALLASANRGTRAIREAGGCFASVLRDGMTRSPVLEFSSSREAAEFSFWVSSEELFPSLKAAFESTTNFGKLKSITPTVAGKYCYLRFEATTGDAMGMNMVGKGVNVVIEEILASTPNAKLLSLSSNMCTDKKPNAINWINGRGKSVVCEVTLPRRVVETVLKTTVEDLARLSIAKNFVGSSLAGSIGGNNAHASNIVTALYLATGQDPAQNVGSSNCMIIMEPQNGGEELHVSVTMPSIECGTVGGGTSLATQRECLKQLGIAGADRENPGGNARKLAEIIAASVLSGELSLNAALSSNHLISAHMDLNRK